MNNTYNSATFSYSTQSNHGVSGRFPYQNKTISNHPCQGCKYPQPAYYPPIWAPPTKVESKWQRHNSESAATIYYESKSIDSTDSGSLHRSPYAYPSTPKINETVNHLKSTIETMIHPKHI